ncbi:hypothetical protein KTH_38170 [Thermosporothrix hazakensis]|nr:hypothetical protein KTH_38170 [Thermosporothrix hazakensis]
MMMHDIMRGEFYCFCSIIRIAEMRNVRGAAEKTKGVILLVEDDAQHAELLVQAIAQRRPYRVFHASDGPTTLKFTEYFRPNLFILDYRLPAMNGIELYERLRLRRDLQHIPVLMISAALPSKEIRERGIVGLRKPFNLQDLFRKIDSLLSE